MPEPTPSPEWLPDGHGLDPISLEVAELGAQVHLRLTAPSALRYPRTACGAGMGELWTGRSVEVTCRACLEVVATLDRITSAVSAARAEVKAAVEEWFSNVSLDDLFATKGWELPGTAGGEDRV